MLSMIPLYKPAAVAMALSTVFADLEFIVTKYGYGEHDMTRLLNSILSGEELLWVLFDSGHYAAVATTSIREVPTKEPKRYLYITTLARNKKMKGDYNKFFIDELEKFGKQCGCCELRFSSPRAFEKIVKPLGFSVAYTEFRKEI